MSANRPGPIYSDLLLRARRSFFEHGRLPSGEISDAIVNSWRRCRTFGLDEQSPFVVEPVDQARLGRMRERHEVLWRLARVEIETLAPETRRAGSIVLLTDADGWILDAEGNPEFLDKAGRVALMPGARWNEADVGTNAIGTAIAEQRAIQIRGAEHYSGPNRILNCSAVPIFDPYGQISGILDISGDARFKQVHALGLARLAALNIEHRYFDHGISDAEVVRLHPDRAVLGTTREALLAFRHGRLVAANSVGLELFNLQRGQIGRASLDALFGGVSLERLRDDGMLHDRHGRQLFGQIDPPEQRRRARAVEPIRVPDSRQSPDTLIFDDSLRLALNAARRVLDADIPVLVQGETGTGKEVFARELHRLSARAEKLFVAVNCAALPEGLIESELFGYESGAFTGARKGGNQGLLRAAQGGVLFLDEIGDMPLALQPRLLRVLQDRELTPLGGGKPVKLDFALICATHRDLDKAVADGRFRPDLYYRISHHRVELPALREQADVGSLLTALWAGIGEGRAFEQDAWNALLAYAWPGNLRQMVSCLRTLAALTDPGTCIGTSLLPGYLQTRQGDVPRMMPSPSATGASHATAIAPTRTMDSAASHPAGSADLQSMQLAAMRAAIDACHGNLAQAARKLGISRSTLYRRLRW